MGADDGHGPGIPCENPNPNKPSLSKPRCDDMFKAAQVEAPSNYTISGKLLLAAAGAFAGILLALIALRMYESVRRRHVRNRRRRLLRSVAMPVSGDNEDRESGVAPCPRGLDPAVLRALSLVAAGAGAGDCAVCLAELEPDEKARALPRCAHRFHVECIDAWFRENSTCPLCRADVEAPGDAEAQPEVRIEVVEDSMAKVAVPGGTGPDLDKTRGNFASARSASF